MQTTWFTRRSLLLGLGALTLARPGRAASRRLVTLSGAVTETVFALGLGADVVGVDLSSTWPAAASALPQVGYHRQISAEGVLGLGPSAVYAVHDSGPPTALAQIAAAGVAVRVFEAAQSVEAAEARLRAIGEAAGRRAEGDRLADALREDFAAAASWVAGRSDRPRALFVYARGAGAATVAGRETAADAMIHLAGGQNTAAQFEGYRPLTPEAAASAAPEVIVLTTTGLASLGGEGALWRTPGLSLTPAARARRVVVLDDLSLLGFGPRAGQTALTLARALRGVSA